MTAWFRSTIGELCDAGLAELQTGPFGSQLHAYDYVAEGVPVVPTEAIRDRRIDHSVLPKISPAKANDLERHRLRTGDILFARRGVQATGHTAYVREEEDGFICGTGAMRLRLHPNREVLSEFLSHVFANSRSVEWFKFHAIGATMPNLNEAIVRAFPLAIPPVDYQRDISTLLSAIDEKIRLNQSMNEASEALARTIFYDWFVGFGPIRAKAKGQPAYLALDLWNLFPEAFDAENIPHGWRRGELQEIVEFNPKELLSSGVAAAYLDMAALPTSGSVPDPPILRPFTSGMRFRNGDTLLARITPCLENGKAAYIQCLPDNAIGWGSTEFIVMRSIPPVPKPYAYILARDPEFRTLAMQSMTGTSGRQRALTDALARHSVVIPQPFVWTAFGALLDPLFAQVAANGLELQTLANMRDLLLPKLLSGEIRLKDTVKQVEEAL